MSKKSTLTSGVLILIFKKRLSCIRFISSINFILHGSNSLVEMEKKLCNRAIDFSKNYGIKPSLIKKLNQISFEISKRINSGLQNSWPNEEKDAFEILDAEVNLFIEKVLSEEQIKKYLQFKPSIKNGLATNFLIKIAQDCLQSFDKIIIQILSNDLNEFYGGYLSRFYSKSYA